jgi:hypothetical protein
VTTIRDSEQPVWASIFWRAWEANFAVKIFASILAPPEIERRHERRSQIHIELHL